MFVLGRLTLSFEISEKVLPHMNCRLIAIAVLALLTFANTGSAQTTQPTLYIIGDSTVKNSADGQLGWGDPIRDFFDVTRIRVENRARGGRSSRTFQTEGLWDQVIAELKPGDFVLMQFGHNDGGPINDESRARGSLPGLGNEFEPIENQVTKKTESVHTFGWYMRKFVADTKAKGATPIVLSPVPRNIWIDGKVERMATTYGGWAARLPRLKMLSSSILMKLWPFVMKRLVRRQ